MVCTSCGGACDAWGVHAEHDAQAPINDPLQGCWVSKARAQSATGSQWLCVLQTVSSCLIWIQVRSGEVLHLINRRVRQR